MFTSLQNVIPSHLMDGKLHDFKGIKTTGVANPDGDKAFDPEDLPKPPATLQFMDRKAVLES
jgi:tRNA 2-thiocytidine biosynthesis protein TtcA